MLVLSRRSDESITFPNVGITVKILRVDNNKAKLGISAPAEVRILRAEMEGAAQASSPTVETSETLHAIRNRLNTVNLAVHLYHQQMAKGQLDAANLTFLRLVDDLESIDRQFKGERLAAAQPKAPNISCLLVEDDRRQRELLADYLSNRGVSVVTASDADDALDQLEADVLPDFVLLDLRLPGNDGADTVRRIRNVATMSPLRVFAVSGTSPDELGISTGHEGVDHWFPKPTNPERLIERMSAVSRRFA